MNKMKEVAKMLGLDIDEEFDIMMRENEPSNYNPFKIRERGLIDKDDSFSYDELFWLLFGRCEIVERPWKPKKFEEYFYINIDGNVVSRCCFQNSDDAGRMNMGNCFRTMEKAIPHTDEMVAKMKEVLE
jgi:hypothetical protein